MAAFSAQNLAARPRLMPTLITRQFLAGYSWATRRAARSDDVQPGDDAEGLVVAGGQPEVGYSWIEAKRTSCRLPAPAKIRSHQPGARTAGRYGAARSVSSP
jgi:hypothetical protein